MDVSRSQIWRVGQGRNDWVFHAGPWVADPETSWCRIVNREKGLLSSACLDDFKLAWKKQNIDPMWAVLMKEVDFGEQHPSLTTFISVALHKSKKRSKILWTITETCSNPESPQEQQKSYFVQWSLTQTFYHGPMIWKVNAKKCVERYCELANKTTQHLCKVTTQCHDDHELIQRGRIRICWRIVKSMLSNCPEMPVFCTHW